MPTSDAPAVQSLHEEGDAPNRRGDPLAVMYLLAALLVAAAALLVVILMFIPRGWMGSESSDLWIPGSVPGWRPVTGRQEQLDAPGVTEMEPGRYLVIIEARNWQFSPDEIRVPVNAEVTFRARAVEDLHGLTVPGTPVVLSLNGREASETTHRFTEVGEYPFVCSEYCGPGHVSMTGKVIVE